MVMTFRLGNPKYRYDKNKLLVRFKSRKHFTKNIFFIALSQKIRQVSACRIFLSKPQAWYIFTRHACIVLSNRFHAVLRFRIAKLFYFFVFCGFKSQKPPRSAFPGGCFLYSISAITRQGRPVMPVKAMG